MSIVGDTTGVFSSIGKAWDWLEDWFDPARLSAKRLIAAFEAHGIRRQQIIRLLPSQVMQGKPGLTMADFSSPKKLKLKLSPALLDWAAEYLNVQRAWLDGVDVRPHTVADYYKHPAKYREWLQERQLNFPKVHRLVCIWKGQGQPFEKDACGVGPLCLVYEETSEGLDGMEFSRYWLLSNEWSLDHAPCVENMVAAVAIGQSLGISVTGRDVPLDKLLRLETGKLLLPEAAAHIGALWYPEDLVNPLPGQDSDWRRSIWQGAQAWLAAKE